MKDRVPTLNDRLNSPMTVEIGGKVVYDPGKIVYDPITDRFVGENQIKHSASDTIKHLLKKRFKKKTIRTKSQ